MARDLYVAVVPVPVSDQEKALYFYTGLIGFRLVTDVPMDGSRRWIVLGSPAGGVQITLVNWHQSMPSGSLRGLTLGTHDIIVEHARLKKAGVSIEPIVTEPWGRFANLWDWDGNGLVLAQWNR